MALGAGVKRLRRKMNFSRKKEENEQHIGGENSEWRNEMRKKKSERRLMRSGNTDTFCGRKQ